MMHTMPRIAVAAALMAACAVHAQALPQLNVDKSRISVSGLSAGGFMANQLGWAHSSTFMGVGVFAGGPYTCARQSNYTSCMYNALISSGMQSGMQANINNWSGTSIDAKANVANQKIFLFVGTSDYTVGPNPMDALNAQYANNGVPAGNLEYVKRSGTAHTFPTDFDSSGDNACGSTASPYISNCGYDGAKAVLTKIYGTLNARNNAPAAGNYLQFNQGAFTSNPGMASTGWVYVPSNCAAGAQCKLHVALHGCAQSLTHIGDRFVRNTGYTRWADTNSIIVLFPQAKVDSTNRSTSASGSLPNPNACWDWVGWYGSNFAQKAGSQITAIKAMVDHVAGGAPGSSLPPPTGVSTSGATSSSMVVSWARGRHDLQLDGTQRGRQRRREHRVVARHRHHHRHAAAHRHLPHVEQLCAHRRGPRVPERRLHLCERVQPEHGPVEHLRDDNLETDRPQPLRHRHLPLTSSPASIGKMR
jgi:dienelactone hydrolase